jgi:type IV pilus assembly protein PilA
MSAIKAVVVDSWALHSGDGEQGADPGGAGGRTVRVLGWSGPGGWRHSHPLLVARTRSARVDSDAGFSLIELMVVLLIMGILLAIAIPTFLGTTGAADDRSVQSNLVTAFTDAKTQFQNAGQTYDVNGAADASALAGVLTNAQLNISFTTGSSTGAADVSVAVSSDGNGVVLAAWSLPGNCFYVVDNSQQLTGTVASTNPYVGLTSVGTTSAPMPPGSIGLPSSAGTSYVTVSGDVHPADCNALRPMSSGTGTVAKYQTAGFPPAVDG